MGKFGLRRGADATVLPFLSHQVIEYLASIYLLQVGTKVDGRASTVCYVLGALMLAAAAFSGKPLGGGRLSRRMHRFIDLALIAAVAAAPFVFDFADQNSALIRLEGLAVALAVLMWFTNYAPPQPGMGRDIARGLRIQASRKAGQAVGRRLGRRPPR
ncbi:MAG: hypothetical protein AB1679_08065 [Actinomycetota bacterium]|jgi:hypothetical protein